MLGVAATIEDAVVGHEQAAVQDAVYTVEEIVDGGVVAMTGKVVPAAFAQTLDQLVIRPH